MSSKAFTFWFGWLLGAAALVCATGLLMVLLPSMPLKLFGMLLYGSAQALPALGSQAIPYLSLVHAVLGAVLVGWGAALFCLVLGPFRRRSPEGWRTMAVSLAAWFIPDTAYSWGSGFWPNAVLNLLVALLFVLPLSATYRACHSKGR